MSELLKRTRVVRLHLATALTFGSFIAFILALWFYGRGETRDAWCACIISIAIACIGFLAILPDDISKIRFPFTKGK